MTALACLCVERKEITKAYKDLYGITMESMYLIVVVGSEINQVLHSVELRRRVLHMNDFCIQTFA